MNVYTLQSLGLPEIMLWLLTFAVVYGILSQVEIPRSNSARVIIALVSGFMVLFSAPREMVSVMSEMASSLILVVIGLLVLIIFLEMAGLKTKKYIVEKDAQGQPVGEKPANILEAYSFVFGLILLGIAVLVFVNSGGLNLLGLTNVSLPSNLGSWFFLIVIIAAIWFMVREGK